MKRSETMVFSSEDIKEAILWLSREELRIPDDYQFSRDVDIKVNAPFDLNSWGKLEATLTWEDDE
jgi:hypothetical protein